MKIKISKLLFLIGVVCFCNPTMAQSPMPKPGTPKPVNIPAVAESTLPNNLTVAVVERKNVPLVTVHLMIKGGANVESIDQAGLANMTYSMLTKGTQSRSATQIANQIEFLGGSINTWAEWITGNAQVSVMKDKIDPAMQILSDVILNPSFKQEELDLLKTQTGDNITSSLNLPGFLASYVASVYSYGEHPSGGTLSSVEKITRSDVARFYETNVVPNNAVLIFTGDISQSQAMALAQKYFAGWKKGTGSTPNPVAKPAKKKGDVARILVVDMPSSGQASVSYFTKLGSGRVTTDKSKSVLSSDYYTADVLNSVLGGGYSSRLNQEIRMKRGLSYGARSNFDWRPDNSNFLASTQTKNESAAEVASLILEELNKLASKTLAESELLPRKTVLAGDFGRALETNRGLASTLADMYSFGVASSTLNLYTKNVQSVSEKQIKSFAGSNLPGGDIVIVGDYAIFKDDLAKRFPNMKINVVQAKDVDLTKLK